MVGAPVEKILRIFAWLCFRRMNKLQLYSPRGQTAKKAGG
jgi:hypothetical protein